MKDEWSLDKNEKVRRMEKENKKAGRAQNLHRKLLEAVHIEWKMGGGREKEEYG